MKWTEVQGQKFGRLTALEVVGKTKSGCKIWRCVCDCGNEKNVLQASLVSGNTRSCGCLNYDNLHLPRRKIGHNCICAECGKEYYVKPSRIGRTNLHFCSQACRTEYIHKHPEMIPTYKNRDKVTEFFCKKITRSRLAAKKRGIAFSSELSARDLIELWYKQEGKCYYSGIPMSFDPSEQLRLVSIDRIDSSKGYEKGNIVLCSYAFNSFKFTFPKDKILEFISLIRRTVRVGVCVSEEGTLPSRGTGQSAGLDLYASSDVAIGPDSIKIVPTGVRMSIPIGFYGMCVGRSGNTVKRSLFVQTGIIDSDYRGDIGVMVYNASGKEAIISKGDRIGQMIILPYPDITFEEVESLDETERGEGGFGSSGR